MNKKPVIGISMSMLKDSSGIFANYERAYVNDDYIRSVRQSDGIPLMLPILEEDDIIDFYVNTMDALILSGGHDIDPHLYGEELDQKIGEIYPRRDRFDLKLIEKMVEAKKPILGICRGFQLLNVAFGGTLLQDLSLSETKLLKHTQAQDYKLPTQKVSFKGDNFFTKIFNDELMVNTWHHQVLKKVAPCFEICGQTSDGVVEAIEDKKRNIIGVQWHPEMMSREKIHKILFENFIKGVKHD